MERIVFFSDSDALAIQLGNVEGNGRVEHSHRVDVGRARECRPWYVGSGADGCAAVEGEIVRWEGEGGNLDGRFRW